MPPKNKHKARMEYKGIEKPIKVKQSYNVVHAKSKIKDHVAYFKNMSKNRRNREIFNKEPQIYAKPHPSEQQYDPQIDTNSFKAKAAPLRRKSPSSKGTVHHTLEADMYNDQNGKSLVQSSLG